MLESFDQPTAPADHRKLLAYSIVGLTLLYFLDYWAQNILPEKVNLAGSDISIYGLVILLSMYLVMYIAFKRIIKAAPQSGVVYLVVFGCLIVLFSEIVYQLTILVIEKGNGVQADGVWWALRAIIIQPLLSLVISIPMSIKLVHNKKLLANVIFIGLMAIAYMYKTFSM